MEGLFTQTLTSTILLKDLPAPEFEWSSISLTDVTGWYSLFSEDHLLTSLCFRSSTAHFRHALSSSFSAQTSTEGGEPPLAPTRANCEAETSDEAKRTYLCHHPHCFKAYRQLSGLRYHLKHVCLFAGLFPTSTDEFIQGHPQEMPIQLEVVPPTLARQIPAKTKKMRRKDSPEPDP